MKSSADRQTIFPVLGISEIFIDNEPTTPAMSGHSTPIQVLSGVFLLSVDFSFAKINSQEATVIELKYIYIQSLLLANVGIFK